MVIGYWLRAVFRRFIPFSAGKTENESLDALLTDYNSYLRKTVQRYCFLAIYATIRYRKGERIHFWSGHSRRTEKNPSLPRYRATPDALRH